MNTESTKGNGTFTKEISLGIAYCALTIAVMLTMIIWPVAELNLIFKFLIFFGLAFVALFTLATIKVEIDGRNRKLLIGEISKLLK